MIKQLRAKFRRKSAVREHDLNLVITLVQSYRQPLDRASIATKCGFSVDRAQDVIDELLKRKQLFPHRSHGVMFYLAERDSLHPTST